MPHDGISLDSVKVTFASFPVCNPAELQLKTTLSRGFGLLSLFGDGRLCVM